MTVKLYIWWEENDGENFGWPTLTFPQRFLPPLFTPLCNSHTLSLVETVTFF